LAFSCLPADITWFAAGASETRTNSLANSRNHWRALHKTVETASTRASTVICHSRQQIYHSVKDGAVPVLHGPRSFYREAALRRPNFFILGAPKCGTTSLAAWLRTSSCLRRRSRIFSTLMTGKASRRSATINRCLLKQPINISPWARPPSGIFPQTRPYAISSAIKRKRVSSSWSAIPWRWHRPCTGKCCFRATRTFPISGQPGICNRTPRGQTAAGVQLGAAAFPLW
jgi:hypothetical protein